MSDICRVALDAMGGDNAPGEVVKGAVEATKKENDIHVVLVGKEAAIQAELDKYDYSKELIEVVDAADVIETGDWVLVPTNPSGSLFCAASMRAM